MPAWGNTVARAANSSSGMSRVRYDASVLISAAERAPTTAAVTAEWRSVKRSAAAPTGTL